jgi:S1-C subfamily serine protease
MQSTLIEHHSAFLTRNDKLKHLSLGVVVMLGSFVCASCAYTGALRPDFYQPSKTDYKRMHLKVAVLQNNQTKSWHLVFNGTRRIDIALDPGLMNGVKTELSTLFDDVTFTDDPLGSSKETLLVLVNFSVGQYVVGSSVLFQDHLRLDFKDSSQNTVASSERSETFVYSDPRDYQLAAVLTVFSAFTLSPITVPYMTHSMGGHATHLLEGSIQRLLGTVADDIRTNQALYAYSTASSRPLSASAKGDVPDQLPQPPSKYDELMNCVVVIRGSNIMGSGFFVTGSGLIVTNNHIVGSDKTVSVKLRSGAVMLGTVIVTNDSNDLALVSVQLKDSPWLPLGNIHDATVGSDVIAIGAPAGLTWSVAKGIVSAIRDVNGVQVVQTDAAINPGDSGGPLISLQNGRVIGVNSFGARKGLVEGLSFAISSDVILKSFSEYLKSNSKIN